MYVLLSMMAGPRFLSEGFIMKFSLFLRDLKVAIRGVDRFLRLILLSLDSNCCCLYLSCFSKIISLSSIMVGAGGGFHVLFFT